MTATARRLSPADAAVLKPADAAVYLGISRSKLYELTGAGLIPTITVYDGGPIAITRRDLDAYLDERRQVGQQALANHLTLTVPFTGRGQRNTR